MTFKIFISHNVQRDRDIAHALSDKLRLLAARRPLEVNISEELTGGKDWRKWIDSCIRETDLFILVYSSDQYNLDWLLYEAGLFQGACPTNTSLVCIKNSDLPQPPAPLANLQAYDADEKGLRRFFTDLFHEGKFSDKDPINPRPDPLEERGAAEYIQALYAERLISVDYFRWRLEIGPLVNDQGDGQTSMSDIKVEGDDGTMHLLDLDLDPKRLCWGEVFEHLRERGDRWVEDLVKNLELIRKRRAPRQVMTPFQTANARKCYPILSRVERVSSMPRALSVIFVEQEGASLSKTELESLARAPEPFRSLVGMLNMARRFRWNILEHYLGRLSGATGEMREAHVILKDLQWAVTRLTQEAEELGWMEPAEVKAVLPPHRGEQLDTMFAGFHKENVKLQAAVAHTDVLAARRSLGTMQEINKQFLLLGLERYMELVDEQLEPVSVRAERPTAQGVAKEPVWTRVEGQWIGKVKDVEVPGLLKFMPPVVFDMDIVFRHMKSRVDGTMKITGHYPDGDESFAAECEGIAAADNFLSFRYSLSTVDISHIGVMMMRVSGDGRQMEGFYLSKKIHEDGVIGFGSVNLQKVETEN